MQNDRRPLHSGEKVAQVFDIRDRSAAEGPLAARLARAIEGEVRFDAASRGRYSTDASIYQIVPQGVVLPRSIADVEAALAIAREEGVSVIARGGGTSQAGQTVGRGLVIDNSKYLDKLGDFDPDARTAWVEPGIVLDDLNRQLKASGLWFPVDISTSSRATIGGMAANNSCGSRSLRYGIMADNVLAIEGILADGERVTFDQVPGNLQEVGGSPHYLAIIQKLRAIAASNADDIRERFAKLRRRVGGYNLDSIDPAGHNMARLVIGSEGTLAYFTRIKLALQPLPSAQGAGRLPFPELSPGDGVGAAHREARADRGRAGRPLDPRSRRGDPGLSRDAAAVRARPAGSAAAGGVRGRRAGAAARSARAGSRR